MKQIQKKGHPYGLHRVIQPQGVLPQPAWKIDATSEIYDNELLIDVHKLNIDSASFTQLKEEVGNDPDRLKQRMLEIIEERGKMHNPVTGSGGMLIGKVEQVGTLFPKAELAVGTKIASLVSLTLTPLKIDKIHRIHMKTGQVDVSGKAVLFSSCPFAVLPEDLPESAVLATLDVCGAPAQTARLVQPEQRVVVMGAGGKSGLLCLYHAWKNAGETGQVIAVEANPEACKEIRSLGLAHHVLQLDAANPVAVYEAIAEVTQGKLADLTINCVNIPHTELPAILATRDGGMIYFFSMAVRFTTAALGAEGVGKDVQMMIGNGYAPGHAECAIDTLRQSPRLRELFVKRYG